MTLNPMTSLKQECVSMTPRPISSCLCNRTTTSGACLKAHVKNTKLNETYVVDGNNTLFIKNVKMNIVLKELSKYALNEEITGCGYINIFCERTRLNLNYTARHAIK